MPEPDPNVPEPLFLRSAVRDLDALTPVLRVEALKLASKIGEDPDSGRPIVAGAHGSVTNLRKASSGSIVISYKLSDDPEGKAGVDGETGEEGNIEGEAFARSAPLIVSVRESAK